MLRLVKSDTQSATPTVLQRACGTAHVTFKTRGTSTVIQDLYQSGCAKVRLPRPSSSLREAVLINTAGGLTDGDELMTRIAWGVGARAMVATQTCERIYRSRDAAARVKTFLSASSGALACWLPQETILFDGGKLRRNTRVSLEGDARFLGCEAVILGRTAMGERVVHGALFDEWWIERDGALLFCDRLAFDGDIQQRLSRPAVGDGAGAFATLIYCGTDSGEVCTRLKACLPASGAACSDLGGILLVRLVAADGFTLRGMLVDVAMQLLQTCGVPAVLPRVWTI